MCMHVCPCKHMGAFFHSCISVSMWTLNELHNTRSGGSIRTYIPMYVYAFTTQNHMGRRLKKLFELKTRGVASPTYSNHLQSIGV